MIARLWGFLVAHGPTIGVLAALVAAAVAGGLAAAALGTTDQAPTKTVTISVENGQPGPPGPPGPKGEAGSPGAESCPTGSTFGALVLNTPGGHTEIWTCLKD